MSSFEQEVDLIYQDLYRKALKQRTYINGFPYYAEIGSADGADYYLFVTPNDDKFAIAKARADLERKYDVVTFTRVVIKDHWRNGSN